MRILFIHRDFPGIFRPLAQCFGSMPDTTTLFLSERGGKSLKLPACAVCASPRPIFPPQMRETREKAS